MSTKPSSQPTTMIPQTSNHTRSGAIPRGVSVRNERLAAKDFGEAYLVWRCAVCGATDDLEAFPTACTDCGAAREDLYYYLED